MKQKPAFNSVSTVRKFCIKGFSTFGLELCCKFCCVMLIGHAFYLPKSGTTMYMHTYFGILKGIKNMIESRYPSVVVLKIVHHNFFLDTNIDPCNLYPVRILVGRKATGLPEKHIWRSAIFLFSFFSLCTPSFSLTGCKLADLSENRKVYSTIHNTSRFSIKHIKMFCPSYIIQGI